MPFQTLPYSIIEPTSQKVPIIISVPHCGILFPNDIKNHFQSSIIEQPDDTDWFVHQLYSFASSLGITIIHANYSRWVIDLNRDPYNKPLYDDGRIITSLCPSTDFLGNNLYNTSLSIPDEKEISRRQALYYWPYYHKIQSLIDDLKTNFKQVLLWDAHSIRQYVPTIRKDKFPDMILGDNDEKSSGNIIIKIALENLRNSPFQVNHNDPFKGGYITRYFGLPNEGIHALQLEMAKIHYMDDRELNYDKLRANKVIAVLKPTFEQLIHALANEKDLSI